MNNKGVWCERVGQILIIITTGVWSRIQLYPSLLALRVSSSQLSGQTLSDLLSWSNFYKNNIVQFLKIVFLTSLTKTLKLTASR